LCLFACAGQICRDRSGDSSRARSHPAFRILISINSSANWVRWIICPRTLCALRLSKCLQISRSATKTGSRLEWSPFCFHSALNLAQLAFGLVRHLAYWPAGARRMHSTLDARDLARLSPTAMVRRHAAQMVAAAAGRPILDIACGGGRNAVLVAYLGGSVICVDNDLSRLVAQFTRLKDTVFAEACSRITPLALDLIRDEWPFQAQSAGGILNIHFLRAALFPVFASSTARGGCLLLETVQNRGENYLTLPKQGALRSALEPSFALDIYSERRCGPDGHDSVSVQLFGPRR